MFRHGPEKSRILMRIISLILSGIQGTLPWQMASAGYPRREGKLPHSKTKIRNLPTWQTSKDKAIKRWNWVSTGVVIMFTEFELLNTTVIVHSFGVSCKTIYCDPNGLVAISYGARNRKQVHNS